MPATEDDFAARLSQAIRDTLALMQTNGKLISALKQARYLQDALGDVITDDVTLGPELTTCLEAIREVAGALERAHNFTLTRHSVHMDKLFRGEDD